MKAVTQWFSCKTPPVHAGEYEFRGKPEIFKKWEVFRAAFLGGEWRNRGVVLEGIMCCPERYEWRGLAEKP